MVSENEGTASPDPTAAVAQMPFAAALGVVLDAAGADEVRGRLAWAPERCTTAGAMHGGALMGLADTLGGSARTSTCLRGRERPPSVRRQCSPVRCATVRAVT